MKKQLIITGIVVLLICVGLSGCFEESGVTSGDTDEVELVSYSVETLTLNYPHKKIGDGFIHSNDAGRYLITGTVKNIADRNLDRITITARFYDSDNELLHTKTDVIFYLTKGNIDDFSIIYYYYEKYFEFVESVRFEFSVS